MAYVSPSGIVRAADRTTEVDGRRRDAATRRTGPAPVTSREVSVPADPEEDVNSSDIEPAVALKPTRVTCSGTAGLRTATTHTPQSVQTTRSTVVTQESAEPGDRDCEGLTPEYTCTHSEASECAHAARWHHEIERSPTGVMRSDAWSHLLVSHSDGGPDPSQRR